MTTKTTQSEPTGTKLTEDKPYVPEFRWKVTEVNKKKKSKFGFSAFEELASTETLEVKNEKGYWVKVPHVYETINVWSKDDIEHRKPSETKGWSFLDF